MKINVQLFWLVMALAIAPPASAGGIFDQINRNIERQIKGLGGAIDNAQQKLDHLPEASRATPEVETAKNAVAEVQRQKQDLDLKVRELTALSESVEKKKNDLEAREKIFSATLIGSLVGNIIALIGFVRTWPAHKIDLELKKLEYEEKQLALQEKRIAAEEKDRRLREAKNRNGLIRSLFGVFWDKG